MKTLKYIIILMFILLQYSIIWAQCTTSPTNLISWWTADDTAQDLYGNNHGVPQGGVAYGDGVVNNAFYFDGIDDVVVVPSSTDLNITGDVTVELWVRRVGYLNQHQTVLSKGGGNTTSNIPTVFEMRFEFDLTEFLFEDINGNNFIVNGPAYEDSRWHHYAYVRQGNSHIVYADGFEFGWRTFANPPASSAGFPLTIGAQYHNPTSSTNDYSRSFAGEVDEVGVYNHALSEAEIQNIYNALSDGKCKNSLSNTEVVVDNKSLIKIYPNPVKNTFTLDISKSTFSASGNLKLQILDLSGRLVKQVDKINTLKRNIDINDLNSGMYLYQLSGNGSDVTSGKIIKK